MDQHELRAKLADLWDQMASLARDDPFFQKKQMFLYGQLIFYTKIYAVVQQSTRFVSASEPDK